MAYATRCNCAALQHAYAPSHIIQHAALSPEVRDYIIPELALCSTDVAPRGGVPAYAGTRFLVGFLVQLILTQLGNYSLLPLSLAHGLGVKT